MKLRALCYSLFLIFLAKSHAQETNCLLWEIQGKGIKTSYLYGTMHLQDERVFIFDSLFWDVFYSCEAYAMELLVSDISNEELSEAMLLPKGKVLGEYISDARLAEIDSLLKINTGNGVMLYQRMKPFFISSQLMQARMPKGETEAMDIYLLNLARSKDMQLFGIERLTDQTAAIDKISISDQVDMLVDGLQDTSVSRDDMDIMINTYRSQNLDSMLILMADTSLPDNFNKAFLIDRNKNMAKNIAKISRKFSCFHAIGAAHLPGPKGVIVWLRKMGYTVTPVCR